MTIIEVTVKPSKTDFGEHLKKLVSNRCCLNVLRFFVVHPNGRFSKLAILHGLDDAGRRPEIENALTQLTNEGILGVNTENTVCYYQLTRDEPARHLLTNMGKFDWHQWQTVLELV